MPFTSNTDADRAAMLRAIGVNSLEELLQNIPPEIRLKDGLDLPEALSEFEVVKELREVSSRNKNVNDVISFGGAGAYDHFVPSVVGAVINRSEFSTPYTPYQAEVSQGTLQAIYEYQTMICNLTGMDAANASIYDGGSALAEACLLAAGHTGRNEIVIAGKVHPYYLDVVRTYCQGQQSALKHTGLADGVANIDDVRNAVTSTTAAVVVQQPNFYGCLEDVFELEKIAHLRGALYVVVADPISLGILVPPGEYGADVVVGEGQGLGIGLSFGGPYLGIFGVKDHLLRKMPGRLSGITTDREGNRGFVLTVQTREQHIRRERATSNICTNEGLMMLAACVYLSLMGKQGIQEVAQLCLQKSHYLAERLSAVHGFRLKYHQPFFKEFVLETALRPNILVEKLLSSNIVAGIDLSRFGEDESGLLIAVTEKRTKDEMDEFVKAVQAL
ncbi:MAG: aminomethyl-transferring glycine dehydrogenase subunit GcvPA [Bacteroidota bacterium]